MAWFKVLRNAKVGKARYSAGQVVEIDPSLLSGKADNFAACDAPGKAKAEPKAEPKKADAPKAVEPVKKAEPTTVGIAKDK